MVGYGYAVGEPMLHFELTPFSYGYNWIGAAGLSGALGGNINGGTTPLSPPQREVRISRTKCPAEMIALCDSDGDGQGDMAIGLYLPQKPGDNIGPPGAVHRGGANVLFCDGHVRWYDRKAITAPTNDLSIG